MEGIQEKDSAELIKMLRRCGSGAGCFGCPWRDKPLDACYQLYTDAADLIEARAKRIAELEAQIARGKDGMRCKFAVDHGGGLVECMGYRKVCCGKQRYDTNDDGSINIVECIDVKGEQEDER